MFANSDSEWDSVVRTHYHDDGAMLEVPYHSESRTRDRPTVLFTRVITYKLPDDSKAEFEVIVASRSIWRSDTCTEARGWKVLTIGPMLVLAVRFSVFADC